MALARSHRPADTSEPILETTVGSVLGHARDATPDHTALIAWGLEPGTRRTWTFAELARDAERVAQALLTHFEPGERIAIWAPNLPEWFLLELGAGLAGIVIVTVNPAYRARELEYVLRQSRSAGLFHVAEFRGNPMAETVREVCPSLPELRRVMEIERWDELLASAGPARALPTVTPDMPAQIQYTSGTTGFPKGALLHHRGLTNNARLCIRRLDARAHDVYAHAMPFFHTAGCVLSALGPLQVGAAHAFLPAFDPARALELVERERATHFLGVPTMLIAMMEHASFSTRDLGSLRVVVSGGASVAPELVRSIESRLGVSFAIVYGQTESSPVITQTRLDDSAVDKAETVGPPLPCTEVKIVDPMTREIVAPGVVGELCTRGYLVMHEYFEKPDASAAAIDAEGWLNTGDLATMDERGYCRITGRLKDMVIRGGENLFPAEIEATIQEHPEVAEVAVIGVPDPKMGEELVAFVRPATAVAPSIESLRAHVRERLAAPKTPRYWVFVDAFPLTGSGKIQKFVLRERWERGELRSS
ncbi:MAG: AMP-binding protein [bacterium]